MKRIIIQGSSRSDGNTHKIVQILRQALEADVVDLKEYKIGQYDYEYANKDDDFLPLMRKLVEYDLIIFATPVYWYSMSGIMKKFFDRLTDCLKIEVETGERLKGMYMAAVSCGPDDDVPEYFARPFSSTAKYLDMKYAGYVHTWVGDDGRVSVNVRNRVQEFSDKLLEIV